MENENGLLKAFFTSDTRIDLLTYILSHPSESFYHRQLQKELGRNNAQLHRELIGLEEAGFLVSYKEGNQKRYKANPKFPFYDELKSIFMKTVGAVKIIKNALDPLAGRIQTAFIYGSLASGEETASSDIDLMIIGQASLADISGLIGPAEEILMREINPTVYTSGEFKDRIRDGNNFLINIMDSNIIFLIGDENDLSAAAGR